MNYKRITDSTTEPIPISDLMNFWVKSSAPEDEVFISALALHARLSLERLLNQALQESEWEVYYDRFPCGELCLPVGPVISVDSITYSDVNSDNQTYTTYQTDLVSNPARVKPLPNYDWPQTEDDAYNAVTVAFTAGYEVVPMAAIQFIGFYTNHMYQQSLETGIVDYSSLPPHCVSLLNWLRGANA